MQELAFRPWGRYVVQHVEEASHQLKPIEMPAGQRLSLQSQFLRTERWFVSGEGVVNLPTGQELRELRRCESDGGRLFTVVTWR